MFLLNNTGDRRYAEVYSDTPGVVFDLSDAQLRKRINREWTQIAPGSIACIIDSSRQLSAFHLISESKRARGMDGEQSVITGMPLATLSPAQLYRDVLSAHGVTHEYLRNHQFVRGFNVANLGNALDALMVRTIDGSDISLGELGVRYRVSSPAPDHPAPRGIPEGITRERVLAAIASLDRGVVSEFGESTGYDLVHEGRRYAPKAVLGLAAREVAGVDIGPYDFKGGKRSKAFRILKQLGFTVVSKVPDGENGPVDWSAEEVRALVIDYFFMLTEEQAGRRYSKAARRRALQATLLRRSEASIEFKHRNVSAVLAEMGIPHVRGYRPAPNYQGLLWTLVNEHLAKSGAVLEALERAASEPPPPRQFTAADFAGARVTPSAAGAPPRTEATRVRPRQARRINFRGRDEANRALGRAGEEFVMEYERWRLRKAGRADLAERVRWVSVENGDGLGYDIVSFEPDGTEIFIEVKSTNQGIDFAFLVSSNEVEVSEEKGAAYRLYRVFDFSNRPSFYVTAGGLFRAYALRPTVYEARRTDANAESALEAEGIESTVAGEEH